ncbi:MAG: M15 family metallopeptidase [Clostridia bacterium]|nr:M15 family metallopeptidase [Clostridia bacterium]
MKRIISFLIIAIFIFSLSPAYAGEVMEDSGLLLLVNKNHPVDKSHKADDLVSLGHEEYRMRSEAALMMTAMLDACKAETGKKPGLVSGYRSYNRQNSTFNIRMNEKLSQGYSYDDAYRLVSVYSAPPGTSEHQTGLAMDLSMDGTLTSAFANTEQGKWLRDNSWRFGYILRYTEEKTDLTLIGAEGWHFRYVGIPHAQIMYDKGWCFEEYIAALCDAPLYKATQDGTLYKIAREASLPLKDDSIVSASSDNMGGYIVTSKINPFSLDWLTKGLIPKYKQMLIAGVTIR